MSLKIKKDCLLPLIFSLFHVAATAQIGLTPYSTQGVGMLSGNGFAHNVGMGGVGIAAGSSIRINNVNPALLYRNNLSSFDVSLAGESKNFVRGEQRVSNSSGGLAYGAFAFPVAENRWTLSVGLMPYSTVRYQVQATRPISGSNVPAVSLLEGDGGISQVYLSNGVRVYKNLAVGLKVAYLFGAIDRSLGLLPATAGSYIVSQERSQFYSGLLPELGIHYAIKTGKTSSLSAGITYQPQTTIRVTSDETFQNAIPTSANAPVTSDTISNETGNVVIPQKIGFGLALEKYLKYNIGVDLVLQQWENFGAYRAENQQGNVPRSNDGLQNSLMLAVGGEYIPDASSINSYLKRITFRAGLNFQNTPFYVNERQIQSFGGSVGLSLPLSNLSSLNLALEAGRMGTVQNDLVQENYVKVMLGVSFNDRWFVRRRYD